MLLVMLYKIYVFTYLASKKSAITVTVKGHSYCAFYVNTLLFLKSLTIQKSINVYLAASLILTLSFALNVCILVFKCVFGDIWLTGKVE